jgi:SH3-like domain-containing protein
VIRQFLRRCKVMFEQTTRRFRRHIVFAVAALVLAGAPLATPAQESGLPLPRFASTRSEPINVRVGPGERYEIAWTFLQAGIPVEIIQEFDTWRKIRDVDGAEGWVHQNLLSGNRGGYAMPLIANAETAMRASRADDAPLRARLGPGFKVAIQGCDGAWCEVTASAGGSNYTGVVRQEELWGVYPQEVFD